MDLKSEGASFKVPAAARAAAGVSGITGKIASDDGASGELALHQAGRLKVAAKLATRAEGTRRAAAPARRGPGSGRGPGTLAGGSGQRPG